MKIDSTDEIVKLISSNKLTEHSYVNVELKRTWTQEHGKKISMLANGFHNEKSYLVIGVEDNGTVSGHKDGWLKKEMESLSQHLNSYLDPSVTVDDLISEDILGNKIIILTIKNPGVVVKWNHRAFGGKGTTKHELTPEEILELNLQLPGLTDITKRKKVSSPDIDLVKKFCEIGKVKYEENVLDKYHLQDTKCSDLLFDSGCYRVIRYDNDDQITLNETRKGLINVISDEMYKEIREYYKNHIENENRLSDKMLREALGNCLGHAAYHDNYGEIIIEMHPKKLTVSNLAYQEYISLANKWFSQAHKSPNPFFMEVLRFIGKVDELGTGKKKLFSDCLTQGFNAPFVNITDAARNKRWSLTIPVSEIDTRYSMLKDRINSLYKTNSEKCLIAYAMVLWRDKKFSEIAKYFDTFEAKIASEIISDRTGPVWFYKHEDRLVLNRWVEVLINEGKASKGFSESDEIRIFDHCKSMQVRYNQGLMTSKEFRDLACMSDSSSDRVLSSNILTKWVSLGKLERIKKGTYRFLNVQNETPIKDSIGEIFKAFEKVIKKQK